MGRKKTSSPVVSYGNQPRPLRHRNLGAQGRWPGLYLVCDWQCLSETALSSYSLSSEPMVHIVFSFILHANLEFSSQAKAAEECCVCPLPVWTSGKPSRRWCMSPAQDLVLFLILMKMFSDFSLKLNAE